MVWVSWSGLIRLVMMVSGRKDMLVDKVSFTMLMETCTMAVGSTINAKVTVFTPIKMELATKVIGKTIHSVELEQRPGLKAQDIKVCTLMDRSMEMEPTNGSMGQFTLETGTRTR